MEDWRDKRACRDVSPDVFYPVNAGGGAANNAYDAQVAAAKAVCARCDAAEDCLAWALERGEDHGIWGGLTERERRSLREHGSGAGWMRHVRAGTPPCEPCLAWRRDYNAAWMRAKREVVAS